MRARLTPERRAAFKGGWRRRSRRPRRRIPTGRSRSGRRTSTASPLVGFVQPTSGETVWYLCSGLSKPFFAELLAAFARQVGAGRERSIVLVLDNAGWHGPKGLAVPEGISLVL